MHKPQSADKFTPMFGTALFNDASLQLAHNGTLALFAALTPLERFGLAGLLGLVFGSFLSVVVYRTPIMLQRAWERELRTLNASSSMTAAPSDDAPSDAPLDAQARFNLCLPGSSCTVCGHRLRVWENLPLISFILLRGKCAACRTPIGWIYPLLEALSAVVAILMLWRYGASAQTLAGFALAATLLALGFIDARTGLLPDAITLPLLWAGLLLNLGTVFATPESAILGAVCGYASLWAVYWLFKLATGKEGMGYGDFKLFAALGAWLGWQALPQILLIAAVAGAVAGIAALCLGRLQRDQPLPFGPFLAGAAILVMIGDGLANPWLGV